MVKMGGLAKICIGFLSRSPVHSPFSPLVSAPRSSQVDLVEASGKGFLRFPTHRFLLGAPFVYSRWWTHRVDLNLYSEL